MYVYHEELRRYKYFSKYDLRFIFIGLVLNYGALLRMPCGVYKHGSSFVAAYLVLMVLLGFPLIFLEVQFGQYHTRGPYNIFRICPFFEGLFNETFQQIFNCVPRLGLGMCFVAFCIWYSMYYVFLMAHGMHLMAETFYTSINISDLAVGKHAMKNINISYCMMDMCNSYLISKSLQYSSQHRQDEPKKLVWNFSFALCLLIAWLLIYIVISKELIQKKYYIRWSSLSSPIIIIFLTALYIVKPNFKRLFVSLDFDDWKQYSSVELWVTALQQVLISNGIGTGIIATFSSYNDFSTYRIRGDACTLNVVGIIVNVVIGVLFTEVAGSFKYYTSNGELLVPKTPAEMQLLYFHMMYYLPIPQIWMTIMNLLFIITGTVGVQLFMEVLLSALKDNIWYTKWKNRFIHSISCSVLFVVSLAICIDTRYFYVANAVDAALNGAIMHLEALLLLVIVSSYGIYNVLLDVRFMSRAHPKGILVYLKYSWIVSFILILLLVVMKWVFLFRSYIGEITIMVLIFLPFFGFAIYNTCRYTLKKRAKLLFKPILAAGPENEQYRQMRRSFLMCSLDITEQ